MSAGLGSTPSAARAASISARSTGAEVRVRLRTLHQPGDLGPGPWQLLRRLDPARRGRGEDAQKLTDALLVVSAHRSLRLTGRGSGRVSSLESLAESAEAAGDAAGDRSRTEDRARRRSCGSSRRGRRTGRARRWHSPESESSAACTSNASSIWSSCPRPARAARRPAPRVAGADPVDALAARQLRDPRPQGVRVAQRAEPVEDAREDLLEDVLGVVRVEAERLRGDREDVAGEALDELVPGRSGRRRGRRRRARRRSACPLA